MHDLSRKPAFFFFDLLQDQTTLNPGRAVPMNMALLLTGFKWYTHQPERWYTHQPERWPEPAANIIASSRPRRTPLPAPERCGSVRSWLFFRCCATFLCFLSSSSASTALTAGKRVRVTDVFACNIRRSDFPTPMPSPLPPRINPALACPTPRRACSGFCRMRWTIS